MASNPLTDALPARYRKAAYAVVFVAGLAFGAWEVADGHPRAFIPAFIAALSAALAHGNVDQPAMTAADHGTGADTGRVRDERGSLMLNPHRGPSRDRTIPGKRRTRARRQRNRSDQGGASS